MNHAIPDVATARRCINALADYLGSKDDSPRAAADLRESVRLLSAQSAWLPIASAPKSRRVLLVVPFERGGDYEIQVGCWEDGIFRYECESSERRAPYSAAHQPSHWMPLPAPPETP